MSVSESFWFMTHLCCFMTGTEVPSVLGENADCGSERMHLVSYSVSACCVSNQIQTMLSRYWGRDEGSNIVRQYHSLHAITTPPAAWIGLWSLCQNSDTAATNETWQKTSFIAPNSVFFPCQSHRFCLKIYTLPLGTKVCIIFSFLYARYFKAWKLYAPACSEWST